MVCLTSPIILLAIPYFYVKRWDQQLSLQKENKETWRLRGYRKHRQGIRTCIPCEARITIIFYWSVQIKLALENPPTHSDTFSDNNDPNDLSVHISLTITITKI